MAKKISSSFEEVTDIDQIQDIGDINLEQQQSDTVVEGNGLNPPAFDITMYSTESPGQESTITIKGIGDGRPIAQSRPLKPSAPQPPIYTITSSVAASGSESKPSVQRQLIGVDFVKSKEGLLFVAEIIGSILCWTLIAGWASSHPIPCSLPFSIFVFVAASLCCGMLFAVKTSGIYDKYRFRWLLFSHKLRFGIIYNIVWAFLFLIAGSIVGSKAVNDMTQILAASTSFSFIVFMLHVLHSLLYYRQCFGEYPWKYCEGCNKECSRT